MSYIRGAIFHNNYDVIKKIDKNFKDEFIKINEKLKIINIEKDCFRNQLISGLKGFLCKKIIEKDLFFIKKKDLINKYNLNSLITEIKKSNYLLNTFEKNFTTKNSISSYQIFSIYNDLEEILYATTILIKYSAIYKKTNFKYNELYHYITKENTFIIGWKGWLINNPYILLDFIENIEIKKISEKMIKEAQGKMNEKYLLLNEIKILKDDIQEKLLYSNKKYNLKKLKQYKSFLIEINKILCENLENYEPLKKERKK